VRGLTWTADLVTVEDMKPSTAPHRRVGRVDSRSRHLSDGTFGVFLCIEEGDTWALGPALASLVDERANAAGQPTRIVLPFFHLSHAALVASDDVEPFRVFRGLAPHLEQKGFSLGSFGYDKDFRADRLRLFPSTGRDQALFGLDLSEQLCRRPALEVLMIHGRFEEQETLLAYAWGNQTPTDRQLAELAREIVSYRAQFARHARLTISQAPFGQYERVAPDLREQLAHTLGPRLFDGTVDPFMTGSSHFFGHKGAVSYRHVD